MNKYSFIFPGQGGQYKGMGKTLYDAYPVFRQTFEEAGDVLHKDFGELCFNGRISELNKIENSLLAILITSIASFRVFSGQNKVSPEFLAGHSLGEYSALVASEVLDFKDALLLVKKRSELALRKNEQGAMAIVEGINKEIIRNVCSEISGSEGTVSIACYNSPRQVVVCGDKSAVLKAEKQLSLLDASVTPMLSSPPFHCSLLKEEAEEFRDYLDTFIFGKPKWNIISNVTAVPAKDGEEIKRNLALQMMMPVQWEETLNVMAENQVDTLVEFGTKTILKNLAEDSRKQFSNYSFCQKEDQKKLQELFGKQEVGKKNEQRQTLHKASFLGRCLAIAVCTQNFNWNNEEYELGAERPYKKIEALQQSLEAQQVLPDINQMEEAMLLLHQIMVTKKAGREEVERRFLQLMEETETEGMLSEFVKEHILKDNKVELC